MSTRLADLVAPHAEPDETRKSYENLIGLGAMAWNLSLLPDDERFATVTEIVRDAKKIGLPLTAQWMDDLIDRKLRLFPSDERFIESWEVRVEADGRFTVFVVSSREAD